MADNRYLLSDEELLDIKKSLSEKELKNILNKEFTFILPQALEKTSTVEEIEEALGNNDIEKILLNKNLNESIKDELINEQISKYLAYILGSTLDDVTHASGEDEVRDLVQKAMNNYLEEYIDYNTILGIISIKRKDIPLLMKCYINAILVMVYMIFVNFFPNLCVGNNLIFYIGTLITVLTVINNIKLSMRIWSLMIK